MSWDMLTTRGRGRLAAALLIGGVWGVCWRFVVTDDGQLDAYVPLDRSNKTDHSVVSCLASKRVAATLTVIGSISRHSLHNTRLFLPFANPMLPHSVPPCPQLVVATTQATEMFSDVFATVSGLLPFTTTLSLLDHSGSPQQNLRIFGSSSLRELHRPTRRPPSQTQLRYGSGLQSSSFGGAVSAEAAKAAVSVLSREVLG